MERLVKNMNLSKEEKRILENLVNHEIEYLSNSIEELDGLDIEYQEQLKLEQSKLINIKRKLNK